MRKMFYLLVIIFTMIIFYPYNMVPSKDNDNSLTLGDAKEISRDEFEKAFQEVAWAFYMRGDYIQYNSMKTNASESYYAPEEATSQNTNYVVCSGLSYYTYHELLNISIPHYTTSLISYTKKNVGKLGIVGYGKRQDEKNMVLTIYDETSDKTISLTNPTMSQIVPYLRVGDILTYTGHTILIYDLIYDSDGNIKDAVTIESTHGKDNYKANTKINNNSNHYLYHNSRLSPNSPVLTNGEKINEGSIHLNKLTTISNWKELNSSNPKYTKEEYSIVRMATIKNGQMKIVYYGDSSNDKVIELSAKTKERMNYPRLFIEKTVSEHNDDIVSVGDSLTYTITIKNSSDKAYSSSLKVVENISDYVNYNGKYKVSKSTIIYKKAANNKLEFTVPTLAKGEEVTISYTVVVKDNTVGKEIKSTGKVGNIDSAIIRNTVGNNLNNNQMDTIKNSYNSLINGNLTGKNLINEIYNKLGFNLELDKFNIKDLISSDVILNSKNSLYKAVLNKYYNALVTIDGKYDLELWTKYSDTNRRADTIYKENFKTGDILIYLNSNDKTTNENGEYAYIYIENQGFVGKNTGRNKFDSNYYTSNNLNLYTNSSGKMEVGLDSNYSEFINYQTLFGKDYFVILRPSLIMNSLINNTNGDIDGDGKVAVKDYILLRKHLLNINVLTGDKLKIADVNNDGNISTIDYIIIRKIILGIK